MLATYCKYCILVTTAAFCLNAVKLMIFKGSRQINFVAINMIDMLPPRPLHSFVSNVSMKAMCTQNHAVVEHAKALPTTLMTAANVLFQNSPPGTTSSGDQAVFINVIFASCKAVSLASHIK